MRNCEDHLIYLKLFRLPDLPIRLSLPHPLFKPDRNLLQIVNRPCEIQPDKTGIFLMQAGLRCSSHTTANKASPQRAMACLPTNSVKRKPLRQGTVPHEVGSRSA